MIKLENFPFETPRPKQKAILKSIKLADKKYNIIEAETGIGKSAVAATVCRSYYNGFIVTSTKQLLDQYQYDFGNKSLTCIKGKANYKCYFNERLNCESGICNINKKQFKENRNKR